MYCHHGYYHQKGIGLLELGITEFLFITNCLVCGILLQYENAKKGNLVLGLWIEKVVKNQVTLCPVLFIPLYKFGSTDMLLEEVRTGDIPVWTTEFRILDHIHQN